MTLAALAGKAGLSSKSVSAYEAGKATPSVDARIALGRALGFPHAFFERAEVEIPTPQQASFRALSTMRARDRDAALAAGALAMEFNGWLEEHFALPDACVPDLSELSPELAAATLRAEWGLGVAPVLNVVHTLETRGARVFSLCDDFHEVDAFSLWRDGRPFVCLSQHKSPERGRFDAAHELGHLVLHRAGRPEDARTAEREADAFASAFLMPAEAVRSQAPKVASIDTLLVLKKRWGVSVAAMNYRLRSLNVTTEWNYTDLCIEIARRGYRSSEPEGLSARESSEVLRLVFQHLREERISLRSIATALEVPVEDLRGLLFGWAVAALDGDPSPPRQHPDRPRTVLRLLAGGA